MNEFHIYYNTIVINTCPFDIQFRMRGLSQYITVKSSEVSKFNSQAVVKNTNERRSFNIVAFFDKNAFEFAPNKKEFEQNIKTEIFLNEQRSYLLRNMIFIFK